MKTVLVPYELLHDIGSYLYTVKPPEYAEEDPEHNADSWRRLLLGHVQDLLFPKSEPRWDLN